MPIPAVVIFDVGKTNKKMLVIDDRYKLLHEATAQFSEISDEDGFPCEDLAALTGWVREKFAEARSLGGIEVKAVNFSAYGASLVYLDSPGRIVAPLYNYLKPYPDYLKEKLFRAYGDEQKLAREIASPVFGSLNSGLQLFRLKNERPNVYGRISFALHLPQYLSYILGEFPTSEITSIGCHTALWDFTKNNYHNWVVKEGMISKFPAVRSSSDSIPASLNTYSFQVGTGLHDSSAALIPYLASFSEPFVLVSTGTWNIALNPFNHRDLTYSELRQDCLCYLSYLGKPVKASRLFAGHEHDEQTKRIAAHFHRSPGSFDEMQFEAALRCKEEPGRLPFSEQNLADFESGELAYHCLVQSIVEKQARSVKLVMAGEKRIFVDGGFARNSVFMNLLAEAFPDREVGAATVPQASAFGAALAIHSHWNPHPQPTNLVALKQYSNHALNPSN